MFYLNFWIMEDYYCVRLLDVVDSERPKITLRKRECWLLMDGWLDINYYYTNMGNFTSKLLIIYDVI